MIAFRFSQTHRVLCLLTALVAFSCGGGENADDDFQSGGADTSATTLPGGYEVVDVSNGGTLTGRVTLAGDVPNLENFDITSDKETCSPAAENNRLEVGPDGGVRYAVIYLDGVTRGKAIPANIEQTLVMDQRNCQYTPHVVAVPVGATLTFTNSDQVAHNVRVEDAATDKILLNRAQPTAGVRDPMKVEQEGAFRVGCDYHPWMNAYVFGVSSPYYAVTDSTGSFTIGDVPPGNYTVKMWFNGIRTIPKRDTQGKLVRYAFADPLTQQKDVTVPAGGGVEVEFQIQADEAGPDK